MYFPILFFTLLGLTSSWLIIHLLLISGFAQGGDAVPQHHHTHIGVIPRIGGVGLVASFTLTYLLCFFLLDASDNQSLIHFAVFAGGAGAFFIGFIDDLKPLGAKVKLLAQVIIALLAYQSGLAIERFTVPFTDLSIELGMLSMLLTIFWFVAMMNLINLIDGLDGLAGGIGLMLMCLLAYLSIDKGAAFSSILSIGMAGAIIGFLFHNFPPANVYLGDSGAYLIGYVIAAVSLINSEKGAVVAALIAPALALALPIIDVCFALMRRALQGLPLFRPDRGHIHHRILGTGLSRRNTVLVLYAISLFALVGGLLMFAQSGRYLPIFMGFAFVLLLLFLRGNKITARSLQATLTDSFQNRQDTRNALYLKDWFIRETARADSVRHLWSDYRFILKKIGFCRCEMKINGDALSFFVPNTPHDSPEELHQVEHTIPGVPEATITLYADKEYFSETQFHLVCDIASEAWAKASLRWNLLNDCPMDLEAVAKNGTSYRSQKARSLYRPTY